MREGILLITIKPHSTLAQFFTEPELKVDISSLTDIPRYLDAMQPKFFAYVREQKINKVEEGYVLLDKNLRELTYDDLLIKAVKEDDIIYIVPAIYGGGGKRGGLLAVLALFAFFAFFPIGAGALGGGVGAGAQAGAGAVAGATGAGGGLFSNIPSFLSNILVNVGLSLLSALFTKKQDNADAASRQNDMFGSLKNSTTSDTPVALHYGQVRVAGQLVSGYIQTINHSRNETVSVDGVIQGLQYSGIGGKGGKGVGSFVLSSSSAFDSYNYDKNYGSSVTTQYTYGRPVGLYAFSNVTNSIATYNIQNTQDSQFLGYSVDSTYLADVRSPILKSTYAGTTPNYLYALSPVSNSITSFDIVGDAASSIGVLVDDNNLNGAHAVDLSFTGDIAYIAARSNNTVTAIDTSNPYSIGIISSYSNDSILDDVRDVKFDTQSNTLYAVSYASNTISAYSSNAGELSYVGSLKNDSLLTGAIKLALDTTNKLAYVAANQADKVVIVDIADPSAMSIKEDFNVSNVIDIGYFPYTNRSKILTIAEGSPTVICYDTTGSRYSFLRTQISGAATASMPGNCSSIVNIGSTVAVCSAESNTVSVFEYAETTERIDEDEGPDTVRVYRNLNLLYSKTDDDYLDGVSSALLMKA